MEKKSGFFATLKQEVVRGLSPSRSRPKSRHPSSSSSSSSRRSKSPIPSPLLLLRRRTTTVSTTNNSEDNNREDHLYSCNNDQNPLSGRCSGTVRNAMEVMAPLMEGPEEGGGSWEGDGGRKEGWGQWVKGQLSRGTVKCSDGVGMWLPAYKRSDLRLLLGVMGAPLAPIGVSSLDHFPHLSIKDTPIESSSAQYILQQYLAASGGQKLHNSIKNAYAMGKVKMLVSEFETATKVMKNCSSSRVAESGGFVLWQMNSDMWYVELSAGGSKVHAGCNGKLVWRHTPWLGAHAAKGPVRPLRRALQGLDPRSTAKMFANARCIGEKKLNGEDCFVLKLSADAQNLKARSEGPAEIIRHVIFGYFSQRTGLLLQIEDSHLTRIQSSNCGDAVYWETTINSFLDDYLPVEGMMIAHSGRSVVTLFKFGEVAMSHSKTRMEESWTIEEVAYNVPGLSVDCFIPPADIRCRSVGVPCELPRGEKGKTMSMSSSHNRSKVAIIGQQQDNLDNVVWRVEI